MKSILWKRRICNGWIFVNSAFSEQELVEKLHGEAEVFFDEGYAFGPEGSGFERMNIACPEQVLLDALSRIEKVFC